MRFIGLDVGTKTIGVALSDELSLIASGLETIAIDIHNNNFGFKRLAKIVALYKVSGFVIGMPINMNGTFGYQADMCEQYAVKLENKFDVPVYRIDERLTTVQATNVLKSEGIKRKERKEVVDKMAATIILQSFLDSNNKHKQNFSSHKE